MELSLETVKNQLKKVKYPGFTRDIVSFGVVKNIELDNGIPKVSLLLPKNDPELASTLERSVRDIVLEIHGVKSVEIDISVREQGASRTSGATQPTPNKKLPDIKYWIAVASGKGGVGKSTLAVNLAIALSRLRDKVGLMDADIWGPSMPIMMGINTRPKATSENKIIPIEKFGLKLMSIGFLIDEDETVIWRGPMVHGAIKQFIEDVTWTDTDYLVVDLPPGTGDAQLSLIQTAPISGGVIVTTPQDVALIDVKRGVGMFRKLNVPILGVVENMSYLELKNGAEPIDIFGRGGGRRMAEKLNIPFLGEIPLDPNIRIGGDNGTPIIESHPNSTASISFMDIAKKVLNSLESS